MLINKECNTNNHVEFISYDGCYPNLCRGKLVLKVNGKTYEFSGYEERFWSTGGACGFYDSNYTNPYIRKGEWYIDVNKLPEELKEYAAEIDEVFNENVQYGCCGGCL